MSSLITFFFQLAVLRRCPQDLPSSRDLLILLAAVSVVLGTIGAVAPYGGVGRALAVSLLDAAVSAGLLFATLTFAGKKARFVQTMVAVFGLNALFTLLLLFANLFADGMTPSPMSSLISLIALGWVHVALGHVLRHALEMELWAGIVIALGYTVIGFTLVSTYLPPAALQGS